MFTLFKGLLIAVAFILAGLFGGEYGRFLARESGAGQPAASEEHASSTQMVGAGSTIPPREAAAHATPSPTPAKPRTPSISSPKAVPPAPALPSSPAREAPVPPVPSAPLPAPTPDWTPINEAARSAIVNILCTQTAGSPFSPISGSGVIVDPRGVILTNAHVAEYFLLTDYPRENSLECVIRAGSPARSTYRAALLFLPPRWIEENAEQITAEEPLGTGEHDYALLLITARTDPAKELPAAFPFLQFAAEPALQDGEQVLIGAYPAGFLGGIAIQQDLYLLSSLATVTKRYTFGGGAVDEVGLGGNLLAQRGSSGGAMVAGSGAIAGLLTLTRDAETTDARDLRAITASHIEDSVRIHTGAGLAAFLARDLPSYASAFMREIAPLLTKRLTDALERKAPD